MFQRDRDNLTDYLLKLLWMGRNDITSNTVIVVVVVVAVVVVFNIFIFLCIV